MKEIAIQAKEIAFVVFLSDEGAQNRYTQLKVVVERERKCRLLAALIGGGGVE
ncbi:hypothetical protein TcasGA2_TC033133 [Tribolium castaneum]|uniref:Uncharacterized protein n=1 Tax=Tribolium castaneum TaxID=7070 RepID=A0A139WGT1_TRICA|nr:hypothetical protein TcasGA2_TC033133 [Tribolium castaneum]